MTKIAGMSRPPPGTPRRHRRGRSPEDRRARRRHRERARPQRRPAEREKALLADLVERSRERFASRAARLPKPSFPEDLPIAQHRDEIAKLVAAHPVTIVCGETGSGKTTQVPKICLSLGRGAAGLVGCTQPRRIAARSRNRLAQELAGAPKGFVGHKIRFQDATRPDTVVKVMTDGILLAETHSDRELRAYDTIIVDEAHERSLNVDFLLGYMKRLVKMRPELKVIVTSATIDTERFSQFFDGAPVIEVSGRTYPVEVRYRPEFFESDEEDDEPVDMGEAIVKAVDELSRGSRTGDMLVFLPGEREIREAAEVLRKHHPGKTEIVPLFARLSAEEQDRVFERDAARRIVLATNVAETSLTVPGIHYVIDTGLARVKRYSPRQKIDQLRIEPIAQAAARQRAGRCGRVASGIAIRLYAEENFNGRPEFTTPEILRTSLASVILRMAALELGPIQEFSFIEPPTPRQIEDGYRLLFELGAIDNESRTLTEMGKELARLPVDPRIGPPAPGIAREVPLPLGDGDPRGGALDPGSPRPPPGAARGVRPRARGVPRRRLRFPAAHEPVEVLRQRVHPQEIEPQALRDLPRAFPFLRAHARVARPRRAASRDGFRAQDPRQPNAGDLRAGPPCAPHRPPRQRRHEGAGRRPLQRPSRHPVPRLAGLRIEEEPAALDHGGRAAGDHARLRAQRRARGARLDREGRRASRGPCLGRAALGQGAWRGGGVRERVAAWPRAGGTAQGELRKDRSGEGATKFSSRARWLRASSSRSIPFWTHNQGLIREIEELEHRARRPDVLVDDRALFDFYATHIPKDVRDTRTFDTWYKAASEKEPKLLHLTRADLMRHGAESVTEELFPRTLAVGEAVLPLAYRFEPGHPMDGVTVNVPLALLNQLDETAIDWLVPGMVREKVAWTMKALPKRIRSQLVPVPEHTTKFLERYRHPGRRNAEKDHPCRGPRNMRRTCRG